VQIAVEAVQRAWARAWAWARAALLLMRLASARAGCIDILQLRVRDVCVREENLRVTFSDGKKGVLARGAPYTVHASIAGPWKTEVETWIARRLQACRRAGVQTCRRAGSCSSTRTG